jgi:hypothetical protein
VVIPPVPVTLEGRIDETPRKLLPHSRSLRRSLPIVATFVTPVAQSVMGWPGREERRSDPAVLHEDAHETVIVIQKNTAPWYCAGKLKKPGGHGPVTRPADPEAAQARPQRHVPDGSS